MGKMYYTEEEAAAKLGVSAEELANYVRDQKLRVYKDGAKNMYKAEEVDALGGAAGEEEIELAPADTGVEDAVSLTEADSPKAAGKEDTVITAEGISIFDDEDLDIEAADPLAKTQIAPSLEDQIALEGVGSGSGLLDLTRESDDTSLGADVLDEIDMEEAVGTGLEEAEQAPAAPAAAPVAVSYVETVDAGAAAFGGISAALALLALLIGAVMLAAMTKMVPAYLVAMKNNLPIVAIVGVVLVGLFALVGYLMGSAASRRQM